MWWGIPGARRTLVLAATRLLCLGWRSRLRICASVSLTTAWTVIFLLLSSPSPVSPDGVFNAVDKLRTNFRILVDPFSHLSRSSVCMVVHHIGLFQLENVNGPWFCQIESNLCTRYDCRVLCAAAHRVHTRRQRQLHSFWRLLQPRTVRLVNLGRPKLLSNSNYTNTEEKLCEVQCLR